VESRNVSLVGRKSFRSYDLQICSEKESSSRIRRYHLKLNREFLIVMSRYSDESKRNAFMNSAIVNVRIYIFLNHLFEYPVLCTLSRLRKAKPVCLYIVVNLHLTK
jgi:hypothetical protein